MNNKEHRMYIGFYTQKELVVVGKNDMHLLTDKTPLINKSSLDDLDKIIITHDSDDFKITVTRDGLFGIRIKSIESDYPSPQSMAEHCNDRSTEKWRLYVDHINAFQVALMTASLISGFKSDLSGVHDITREDALILKEDMRFEGLTSESNKTKIRMFDSNRTRVFCAQQFLFEEYFEHCLVRFKSIIKAKAISHVANLARSLVHYQSGNNNLALALSWFDIEILLKRKLKLHLEEPSINYTVDKSKGTKRFNNGRCKYLVEEMEVAKVVEILELLELITYDLYSSISKCRKERNKMVHGSNLVVSSETASNCISLLLQLINSEFNSDLKINTSRSMSLF
ncbi:hypothetical protein [Vibrio crassostreae]|uniref:hypothetical protein n=1 Tax=Vibrio crassostreae TaxID=246167 RepID=UPI0011131CC9|nr:hypothetical protein [Vibrio crassostreae]